jgi:hypothetical protein
VKSFSQPVFSDAVPFMARPYFLGICSSRLVFSNLRSSKSFLDQRDAFIKAAPVLEDFKL